MSEFIAEVVGQVEDEEIPFAWRRSGGCGSAGKTIPTILDAVEGLPRGRWLKIKHNSYPQNVHCRLHGGAKRLRGLRLKVIVRGEMAYIKRVDK